MEFLSPSFSISGNAFLYHLLFGFGLLIISIIITRLMISYVRIMDIPNDRSSHSKAIPKSGGIAIVVTFVLGMFAIYYIGTVTHINYILFFGFTFSALLIAIVSLFDDINYKSFVIKLGSHFVAASILIAFGIIITDIHLPFWGFIESFWIMYPMTLLWVIGLTNSFNFMDGLDGLSGGTAVIVSLFFGYITLMQGSIFTYIICYTIIAGSLGFLVFNFPPARIFMGDVGSGFLGFVFAAIAILASNHDHSHTSFFVMPLLLFNFIFDTFFTFIRRFLNGDNISQAHKTHLYQLLNQLGFSHKKVTLIHYMMSISQGIGAIILISIPGEKRLLVFMPFLVFQIIYCFLIIKSSKQKGLL